MPDKKESTGFLYIDLAELTPGKPFAGFAMGDFVDMLGREVKFTADKIQSYLKNTMDAIKSRKDKGMPGLPIDEELHNKGKAAGWITGVELAEVEDSDGNTIPALNFIAEWTELGVELIKGKVMTNFSPTYDRDGERVVGGSLTNWPATVDSKGVPLFAAVELSQGIYGRQPADEGAEEPTELETADEPADKIIDTAGDEPANSTAPDSGGSNGDESMTIELTQEQLDELVNDRVNAALSELDNQRPEQEQNLTDLARSLGLPVDGAEDAQIKHLNELTELIQQQAELKWQRQLAEMQRKNRYSELAQRVTGGTAEAPRGFQVDPDKLQAELMKLDGDQAKFWSGLLELTVKNGLIEFNELGHGKQTKQLRPVPEELHSSLKAALAAGNSAEDFFALAGYGAASDYDLTEFEEGK